ncbi:MAG: hypothetical protein QXI73_05520 [Thermoproteota archaeon]
MSYKDLLGEPDLCRGGRALSIIFCCNKKNCPILKHTLNMLNLTYDDYLALKKPFKKEVYVNSKKIDLAFSRSLETTDDIKNEVLKKLGWSVTDYLIYKNEIRKALEKRVDPNLLNKRVIGTFSAVLVDGETKQVYNATALGSIDLKFMILKEVSPQLLSKQEADEEGREVFVGIRMPKRLLEEMDRLVTRGVFPSRSDIARQGITLFLRLNRIMKKLTKEGISLPF